MSKKSKKVMNRLLDRYNGGLTVDIGETLQKTKVYLNGEEVPISRLNISVAGGMPTKVELEFYLVGQKQNIELRGDFITTHLKETNI
jgi:hypothetical protein